MFTGIVETLGEVVEVAERGASVRLTIDAPAIADGVRIGDSIAVGGACLTVVALGAGRFAFEAVRETLERTALALQ